VNQLDETSSDSWAKMVGWYEATIGELVSSISLLRWKILCLIIFPHIRWRNICLFETV
jgi:hypothetical protein